MEIYETKKTEIKLSGEEAKAFEMVSDVLGTLEDHMSEKNILSSEYTWWSQYDIRVIRNRIDDFITDEVLTITEPE